MILLNLLIVGVLAATVSLSNRFFSPVELQDRFTEGQKLYALGDYDKATRHYDAILSTQSNSMINVEEVTVSVDEFILPVRVGATYQLANSYNKLGLELLLRSNFLRSEQKEAEAQERYQEAVQKLNTSLDYFRRLAGDPKVEERTRVMAQYQILETNYQLKNYEQTIQEGQQLLRGFPNSVYEASTYYDIGWSYFELKDYHKAIESFEQVLILAPRGSNADRSLFQIAESYGEFEQYDKALAYLDRLIGRYDFGAMSEEELIEMTTLKLKGLVKETARELLAKAQMRKGDIYASSGQLDKALEAYAVIPQAYSAEPVLVQNSYIRVAELIQKQRGTQAAIAAYKNAIEQVEDKQFQARTQITVALLLFDEKEYKKAVDEYQIYLDAYGDVAARVGFDRDKVLFRLGQCHQAHGQQLRDQNAAESGAAFDRALSFYRQIMDQYSGSPLIPDAIFSTGFSHQMKGDDSAAKPFYQQMVDRYPQHPATPSALLQLARMEYGAGELAAARDIYLNFLSKYPETELENSAHMELGLAYKKLGDLDAAIQSLEAVEAGWSQWGKVQIELVDLYLTQNKDKQAEVVLNRALGKVEEGQLESQLYYTKGKILFSRHQDYTGAIRNFDSTLALSPSDQIFNSALFSRGAAYYELAKSQDARGDSARARANYEASVEDMKVLLSRNPAPNLKDSAFRTLGAGMIRLQREQEAAVYYRELITSSADLQERATFQMLLTELYYDKQDFDQAQNSARQLIAMDFADDNKAGYYRKERAYSIIGNALMQEKRYQEAGEAFAEGLKRYPASGESGNLAFSKAFAEFSAGDYEKSIQSFKSYIANYPNDRNRIHGQYYLAHSYQTLTQFSQAAAAFEELARRYPESEYMEEAMFLVGENYYNEQNYAQAANAYQRLLEKYPQAQHAPAAQYALAWCYFEQEEMEEGVKVMEVLVQRYPQDLEYAAKAQFTVGDYYYNNRVYDQALQSYQRVVAHYPDAPEAAKARALIAELNEIQASLDYNQAMELLETKQYGEAVAGLKQIVDKYPGTYTELAAYSNLGLAYEILRVWREAVENYQKVLDKGGDKPEHADVVSFAKMHRDWIVENRL